MRHEVGVISELLIEVAADDEFFMVSSALGKLLSKVVRELASGVGLQIPGKTEQLILLGEDGSGAGIGDCGFNNIVAAIYSGLCAI